MRREHRKYTPVTCIIGTGTQYINSGYAYTNDSDKNQFYIKYAKTGTSVNNATHLFGSVNSAVTNYFNCYTDSTNGYSSQFYITTGRKGWIYDNDLNIYDVKFTLQNLAFSVNINGTTTNGTYNGTIVCGANIFIFASSQGTAVMSGKTRGKLYSCQIIKNDVLQRDYIPVLDYNKVPCLYERVSQTFYYNSGTGTFGYEL